MSIKYASSTSQIVAVETDLRYSFVQIAPSHWRTSQKRSWHSLGALAPWQNWTTKMPKAIPGNTCDTLLDRDVSMGRQLCSSPLYNFSLAYKFAHITAWILRTGRNRYPKTPEYRRGPRRSIKTFMSEISIITPKLSIAIQTRISLWNGKIIFIKLRKLLNEESGARAIYRK